MGILLSLEKRTLHYATCDWLSFEDIMVREISQPQKGKHCLIPLRTRNPKYSRPWTRSRMWLPGARGGGARGCEASPATPHRSGRGQGCPGHSDACDLSTWTLWLLLRCHSLACKATAVSLVFLAFTSLSLVFSNLLGKKKKKPSSFSRIKGPGVPVCLA